MSIWKRRERPRGRLTETKTLFEAWPLHPLTISLETDNKVVQRDRTSAF